MRPRSFEDHPIPSGSSSAAYALLRIFAVTGDRAYERPAVEVFRILHQAAARHPQAFGHLLQAMHFHFSRPREVALVGDPLDELAAVTRRRFRPTVVLAGMRARRRGGARRDAAPARPRAGGRPAAAYVCENFDVPDAGDRPRGAGKAARVTEAPAAAAGELALGDADGQPDRPGRTLRPGRRALPPAAAARARARREPDRHGRRVRQQRERPSPRPCTPIRTDLVIATKGGQTLVDGQPTADGRPEYLRGGVRAQPATAARRHDRPLPAAHARPRGPDRGVGRRPRRAAARGQGARDRRVERVRRSARARAAHRADRLRSEPLQPEAPRSRTRRSRSASARAWRSCRGGRWPAASSRRWARRRRSRGSCNARRRCCRSRAPHPSSTSRRTSRRRRCG